MMTTTISAQHARREIERLCDEGLDWVELSEAVSRQIGKVVHYDGACWHTMDPSTLLLTGNAIENLPEGGLPVLAACEYASEDINKWGYLAQQPSSVARLGAATQGQPELSNRFRTLLRPAGLDHEMRASFVDAGGCWGAAGFYRAPSAEDFTAKDEAFVTTITRSVGLAYRRALVLDLLEDEHTSGGPGLVILGAGNEIEAASPAAESWLDRLPRETPRDLAPPLSILAVAEQVRGLAHSGAAADASASARMRTAEGEWLLIRATLLRGGEGGRIGVSVEPAGPPEIAQIMISGYGLSQREQEVAYAVLRGASTKEIAEELFISPHTVQDHLKSIFRKFDVRSRRELVSSIYSEHYLPHVAAGRAPTPGGWFGAGVKPTDVNGVA